MHANTANNLIPLASLLGAIGCLAACSASENGSHGAGAGGTTAAAGAGGAGGAGASGGQQASGGTAGAPIESGGAGSGGTAGSGGVAGAECPSSPPVTSVFWPQDEGMGGEAGAAGQEAPGDILCFPDVVCFTRGVPTPGLSFVKEARAAMGSSSNGQPVTWQPNASGLPTAKVSYPEPGKVCMSGDDGAALVLNVGGVFEFVARTGPAPSSEDGTLHASDLGITALSFKVETPPDMGLRVFWISAGTCDEVFSDAVHEGNRVLITSSGETTTLSLAADFTPALEANRLRLLNFGTGLGAYDYCVSDLKFLDVNGQEVEP